MKILITGSNGQLGMDCQKVFSPSHDIIAVDVEELDITHAASVQAALADIRPDLLINCAAFTQVDACETEHSLASKVNTEGPKNLAIATAEHGGCLFHISTDYVFDGKKTVPDPYVEEDPTVPLSFYGKSKLEGEIAVRSACPRHAIIRTAWLYGIHGKNILKTFLRLAVRGEKQPMKVVNDQFGSPTWSYRLALQIEKLSQAHVYGTFHATAEGYCSWYELATYFLEKMAVRCPITPCPSEAYPTPAMRPKNSILENRGIKEAGLNVMRHWKDDIDQFVATYKDRLLKEVSR
jgi:dTDP-4-dehydrorhamnose reductase